MKKSPSSSNLIARNPRASHDYFIEENIEAGIELLGWEVKGLRNHSAHIKESYAIIKNHELWLIGAHISPPPQSAGEPDPTRTRKLLLHRREIAKLTGLIERKGYTLVPIRLYWKNHIAKIELGVGIGKRNYDKRQDQKRRDWEREKTRVLSKVTRNN